MVAKIAEDISAAITGRQDWGFDAHSG